MKRWKNAPTKINEDFVEHKKLKGRNCTTKKTENNKIGGTGKKRTKDSKSVNIMEEKNGHGKRIKGVI